MGARATSHLRTDLLYSVPRSQFLVRRPRTRSNPRGDFGSAPHFVPAPLPDPGTACLVQGVSLRGRVVRRFRTRHFERSTTSSVRRPVASSAISWRACSSTRGRLRIEEGLRTTRSGSNAHPSAVAQPRSAQRQPRLVRVARTTVRRHPGEAKREPQLTNR